MALSISTPHHTIQPTPLTPASFSPYGTVITSPLPPHQTTLPNPLPVSPAELANQSTALKYPHITPLISTYRLSPSGLPAQPHTSLFACFPRALRTSPSEKEKAIFDVKILERHPYTTQTFIPLSSSSSSSPTPNNPKRSKYLIIVAPTLPDPAPVSSLTPYFPQAITMAIRGGLPDLNRIRAFWAEEGTGVTYHVGTWHAPVVVVGGNRIDFVVTQWMSGRAEEDCQEVELVGGGEGGVEVIVEGVGGGEGKLWAKL